MFFPSSDIEILPAALLYRRHGSRDWEREPKARKASGTRVQGLEREPKARKAKLSPELESMSSDSKNPLLDLNWFYTLVTKSYLGPTLALEPK